MSPSGPPRVLAIAPGAQRLGLAVFEGEELIWFGVKSFAGRKTEETLLARAERYLNGVVAAHRPDTLAVEEPFYAQASLSPLLQALTRWAKRWGRRKGLRTLAYLPTEVKERLITGKKTRKGLAEAMVERYWFLYRYRKPARTPHYWQQMFDAVGLGVLAVADVTKRQRDRKAPRGARGRPRVGGGS